MTKEGKIPYISAWLQEKREKGAKIQAIVVSFYLLLWLIQPKGLILINNYNHC